MAAKAPDYDAMDDLDLPPDSADGGADDGADGGDIDSEFALHAKDAGFEGDKAKALWAAIERCNELGSAGPEGAGDAGDEESDETES